MADHTNADIDAPSHALDLPQLYTRPSASSLLSTLSSLALEPPSWDLQPISRSSHSQKATRLNGLPQYLTSIIASPLSWIPSDSVRESIWELASVRLSERSGRNAMPAMTRTFTFPPSVACAGELSMDEPLKIVIHEPSLTSDNLGLKTWASSYLLACRLNDIPLGFSCETTPRALELGAGTGLVGIAAACVWGIPVHLTDLPSITPNLALNIRANESMMAVNGGSATSGVLDWSETHAEEESEEAKYDMVLAADPLYSPLHPEMLVRTIVRWLKRGPSARVVVELPLREAYDQEIKDMRQRMESQGLELTREGEETGLDDWGGIEADGDRRGQEVRCWWGVWRWETAKDREWHGPWA